MTEFIFMLTRNDRTITEAFEVYDQVKDLPGLRYVGFKDVGLPFDRLKELAERMHASGHEVMLEVVSERRDDELRSAEAALGLAVDWLLGGTHAADVLPLIAGSGLRYCPFPGRVIDHPSKLRGTIDDIVESAARLSALEGVGGLDLLAYRYDGDVPAMVRAVLDGVTVPVIAAGSVDSEERIQVLCDLGVWGFTVGSAIFAGCFKGKDGSVREQTRAVLAACGTA